MNRNQVKGAAKEIVGKAQQKAGKVTGSAKHQVKGMAKQVVGKTQRAFGDAQDAAEKSDRNRYR